MKYALPVIATCFGLTRLALVEFHADMHSLPVESFKDAAHLFVGGEQAVQVSAVDETIPVEEFVPSGNGHGSALSFKT